MGTIFSNWSLQWLKHVPGIFLVSGNIITVASIALTELLIADWFAKSFPALAKQMFECRYRCSVILVLWLAGFSVFGGE